MQEEMKIVKWVIAVHARVYSFTKTVHPGLVSFCSKQLASSLKIKLIHFLRESINSDQ